MEIITSFIYSAPGYLLNMLQAGAILLVTFSLFHFTKSPIQRILKKNEVDEYMARVVVFNIYRTILYSIGAITALSQLGINIFAAMTGFGIAGIAVGFAAKDALANVIAGFMMFWDKPFRVGDWVEVDGHFGQINAMSLRSTRIHTRANFHVIIPNQIIANTTVVNHHSKRQVRTAVYFYVPHDCDTDKAQSLLKQASLSVDKILDNPQPNAGIAEVDGGRVQIVVLVWTKNARDAIGIDSAVREAGKKALDKAGFGIAYEYNLSSPKRVTHKK